MAAHHQPSALTPSTPSSSLTLTPSSSFTLTPSTPSPSTSYWQPQPSQVTPTRVDSFDSILSMSDIITPFSGQQSSPFNRVDQSANNIPQQIFQMVTAPNVFQRKYKDETGKVQIPGLKDLPDDFQPNFRNAFIRHIMKLVFSDVSPWSNPSLSVYQHEFDIVYSPLRYRLHGDDAVVLLVSISMHRKNLHLLMFPHPID